MKRLGVLGLVVLAGACSPKSREVKPPIPDRVSVPLASSQLTTQIATEITSVENGVRLWGILAPESESPGVVAKSLRNKVRWIYLTTIDVAYPPPKELWVGFQIYCRWKFPEAPVVLRITVVDEESGRTVHSYNVLLGKYTRNKAHLELVNVLAGLESVPKTMLLTARAEALMMPVGTPEETVDPATATVPPERMTVLFSAPVRINFAAPPEGKGTPAGT